MATGADLKKALKKAGLTQQEAADKMDVSRQTILDYTQKATLRQDILENVNIKLGIDLSASPTMVHEDPIDYFATIYEPDNSNPPNNIKIMQRLIDMHVKRERDLEDQISTLKKLVAVYEKQNATGDSDQRRSKQVGT